MGGGSHEDQIALPFVVLARAGHGLGKLSLADRSIVDEVTASVGGEAD